MIKMIKKIIGYINWFFYCGYKYVRSTKRNEVIEHWYDTTCESSLSFTRGLTPGEGDFIYCPKCGKKVMILIEGESLYDKDK